MIWGDQVVSEDCVFDAGDTVWVVEGGCAF